MVPKVSTEANKFVREAHRQEYLLTEVMGPGSRNDRGSMREYKAVHLQTEGSDYNSETTARK